MGRESGRRRSLHIVRSQLTGVYIGSFRISEGNKAGREKEKKKKKKTRNTCLSTTTSGEVAQMLGILYQ